MRRGKEASVNYCLHMVSTALLWERILFVPPLSLSLVEQQAIVIKAERGGKK